MSQIGFDIGWLNERFQFDNAARNQEVEQAFLHYLKEKKKISIVDIGSGTGANCLYFFEKIAQNQQWFLVEKDIKLVEPTFHRLTKYAEKKGYDFDIDGKSLKIITSSKEVMIHIINGSFFELSRLVDLEKIDVLMAAAVFDLLSKDQFVKLIETIFLYEIVLLTTMNYRGMYFQPEEEMDKKYIDLYERHMTREQHFGKGMGKGCSAFMEQYFLAKEQPFVKGDSSWEIDEKATKMHNYLFGFMEHSINFPGKNPEEKRLFQQWLSGKRTSSENDNLKIIVDHSDFFVAPKQKDNY